MRGFRGRSTDGSEPPHRSRLERTELQYAIEDCCEILLGALPAVSRLEITLRFRKSGERTKLKKEKEKKISSPAQEETNGTLYGSARHLPFVTIIYPPTQRTKRGFVAWEDRSARKKCGSQSSDAVRFRERAAEVGPGMKEGPRGCCGKRVRSSRPQRRK